MINLSRCKILCNTHTHTHLRNKIPTLFIFSMIILLGSNLAIGQDCNNLPVYTAGNTFNNVTITQPISRIDQNIRISGTVNFNANVTFTNCIILMAPNAVININNSIFRLLPGVIGTPSAGMRSVIFGCGTMWQSINVNTGSGIVFTNSNIRDGRQGIVFKSGFNNATSEITGCSFALNSVAITATSVPNFTLSAFSNNNFNGIIPGAVTNLLPPHNNGTVNSPGTTREPIVAMRLFGVTGSIGTSGGINRFEDFSNAIFADGSTLTINNCRFRNNFVTDRNGANSGIGIWVTNSNLTIKDKYSFGASCVFVNNRRGLRFDFSGNLTLENAVFSNQRIVDVEVVNSNQPNNINISNNDFTIGSPTQAPIFVQRAAQGGLVHLKIKSNTITLASGGLPLANNLRFININAVAGATDQAEIANNQITCGYGNGPGGGTTARSIDGIWIQNNADGYQVSGNLINFTNANGGVAPNTGVFGVGIGITLNNGINNIVGPNNVINATKFNNRFQATESWLRCGVHIDQSLNVAVCKNDVDQPRHCYHFNGNCFGNEFGRNKIRDAYYGLLLTAVTFPNQNYRLNEWLNLVAYNTISVDITGTANTPWRYDNNFTIYAAPGVTNPGTYQLPFANGGASGTQICDAILPPIGTNASHNGDEAKKFVDGTFTFSNIADSWDFERNLLNQMIRFPNSFSGEPTVQNYYNSKVNSAIWNFAKAERMLHDAGAISAIQQNTIDQIHASDAALAEDLGTIEQTEGIDTSSATPTLQAEKTNILAQIAQHKHQTDSIVSILLASRAIAYENALDFIEALPSSNILESNQKTVLILQAKSLKDDIWTDADSSILRAIAYSCPEVGGEAVSTARGLLPAPEQYNFNEVEAYCTPGDRNVTKDEQKYLTNIVLFPNPAKDQVTIGFTNKFTGLIEILSIDGKTLLNNTCIDCIQKVVVLDKLQNGLYLVRISTQSGIQQTLKLSVTH